MKQIFPFRQKSSQDSPQSKVSPFNWDVDAKMDKANNNSLQVSVKH